MLAAQITHPTLLRSLSLGVGAAMLTLTAWWALLGHDMTAPMPGQMPTADGWGVRMLAMSIVMWCLMMVAMMLPTAWPMFFAFERMRCRSSGPVSGTWIFIVGYLVAWFGFSVLAASLQWGLQQALILDAVTGKAGPIFGAVILMLVGLFQWSSLKTACLSLCRSPLSFLMTRWRSGRTGALAMGLEHGLYCIGCCWALMLLMFVGGVMSLTWMALLGLYMLAEKTLPGGRWLARSAGVLLMLGGFYTLGHALA